MSQIFGVALMLLILCVWLVGAAKRIGSGQAISGALMGLGIIGFLGGFLLPIAGNLFRNIELPAMFETTTVQASNGDLYAATMPLSRVQRYSADGKFKEGWFVEAAGGHFAIGETNNGKIVVAAKRKRLLQVYEPDGRHIGPQRPYTAGASGIARTLRTGDIRAENLELAMAAQVVNPRPRLAGLLLLPFWHPFVAWLMCAAGILP